MPNRKNVLKIRCSDGRSRKPDELRGNFIHQIRLPGGILFPDLCAQQFDGARRYVVSKLLRRVLLYAIDTLVTLKSPDEIILMSHTPCGAAEAISFSEAEMNAAYIEWGKLLQRRFPSIPVRVFHERHSACGEHHEGHEVLQNAA